MKAQIVTRTLALLVILACDIGSAGADLLVLQKMIVGNTVCGKSNGYDTCIHYKEDGTMTGKAGQYSSKGTYKLLSDGTLCTKWDDPKWDSGCTRLSPSESGRIESVDEKGSVKYEHKALKPGDSESLH